MSMSQAKVVFLGTGASTGVPVIGCDCKVCSSDNPKNKRLRPGLLLSCDGKTFVVDAGPDFREQALSYKIKTPDALFLTHTHYDHIGGLEEFRAFSYHNKVPIPCYVSRPSFESIQKLYYYLFTPKTDTKNSTAQFDFHILEKSYGEVQVCGHTIEHFSYVHGGMAVLGYKFGRLAYVTDIKEYTEEVISALRDIDILILSATCLKHSHLHMTVDEAVAFSQKVQPKKTYFVHLGHEIEYEYVSSLLPAGISLAYDGHEFEYSW